VKSLKKQKNLGADVLQGEYFNRRSDPAEWENNWLIIIGNEVANKGSSRIRVF